MQITPASVLSLAALIGATGSAVAAMPVYSDYSSSSSQDLTARDLTADNYEAGLDFWARDAKADEDVDEDDDDEVKKPVHHNDKKKVEQKKKGAKDNKKPHHKDHKAAIVGHKKAKATATAPGSTKVLPAFAHIIDPLLKKSAAHGTERFICTIKGNKAVAQFIKTKDGKVVEASHPGHEHAWHGLKKSVSRLHKHHHHHRHSDKKIAGKEHKVGKHDKSHKKHHHVKKTASHHSEEATCIAFSPAATSKKAMVKKVKAVLKDTAAKAKAEAEHKKKEAEKKEAEKKAAKAKKEAEAKAAKAKAEADKKAAELKKAAEKKDKRSFANYGDEDAYYFDTRGMDDNEDYFYYQY